MIGILETGTAATNRSADGLNGLILTNDPTMQLILNTQQLAGFTLLDLGEWDAGHAGTCGP